MTEPQGIAVGLSAGAILILFIIGCFYAPVFAGMALSATLLAAAYMLWNHDEDADD